MAEYVVQCKECSADTVAPCFCSKSCAKEYATKQEEPAKDNDDWEPTLPPWAQGC